MAILSLLAKLGLDKSGFDAGMSSANKSVANFGNSLKMQLAGAFGTGAIIAFAKSTIDAVSRVSDLSKELGVSAEFLQEMEYGATQTGSSIEAIAKAFKALSLARSEALKNPKSDAGKAFSAFGIDKQKLTAMSVEQMFRQVANTFKSTDFGSSELALATELLGKAGHELLPMMKTGIDSVAEDARRLGQVFSEEVVDGVDEAGDAVDRFVRRLRGPMATAIAFSANVLNKYLNHLERIYSGLGGGIGALMGGGNFFNGFSEAVAEANDRIDKQEQEAEQKRINRRNNRDAEGRIQKPFDWGDDKEKKSAIKKASIESDQFQKIGAFTGGAARTAQESLLRDLNRRIDDMNRNLQTRGVLIRGEL